MKVIIAPTDFSDVSVNAVYYAADLAQSIKAGLALLNVCQMPVSYSELPVPVNFLTDVEEAKSRIDLLKKELEERTRGEIKIYTEIQTGSVIGSLRNYSSELKPYAVVMGAQGSGAVERMFFGGTTIAAVKEIAWPLIIVPANAKFTSIKKIGLACDLKDVPDSVPAEEIKSLAKGLGASLHVIHVNTNEDDKYGPEIVDESGSLNQMLFDINPTYHFLKDDDIEEGLSAFAEENQLDLLIIVPKKRSALQKLFHKSHSKRLVLHTHVPVAVMHE